MTALENVFMTLDRYGLTDVLIPFFLIFMILYAVMDKTHILGNRKNFNVGLSLLISFMVVIPHIVGRYPPGMDVVNIINTAIPNVSLIIVAVVMVFLMLGVFGAKPSWFVGTVPGIFALISIGVVVYFFGAAAGLWRNLHGGFLNEDVVSLIVGLIVFGLIVWFITRDPSTGEKVRAGQGIMHELSRLFGGNGGGHS